MRELALHITDLVENSIAAKSQNIHIVIREDNTANHLRLLVSDDGSGMTEEVLERITDPFYTSRTTRKVGLGIPLLKAAAEACNGFLTVESSPGKGTKVSVEFQQDHIDRMPLGDIATTIRNLIVCSPEVHFKFEYSVDDRQFIFDNQPILQELDGVSLTEPAVLAYLKTVINNGIAEVQTGNN